MRELLANNEWTFRRVVGRPPQESDELAGGRAAAQGAGPERGGRAARPRCWTSPAPLEAAKPASAVALAARAEAFALKSRWKESEQNVSPGDRAD